MLFTQTGQTLNLLDHSLEKWSMMNIHKLKKLAINLCCCCISKIRRNYIITPSIQSKINHIQFGKSMFYSSNVSHVFLQSILKLYDKKNKSQVSQ